MNLRLRKRIAHQRCYSNPPCRLSAAPRSMKMGASWQHRRRVAQKSLVARWPPRPGIATSLPFLAMTSKACLCSVVSLCHCERSVAISGMGGTSQGGPSQQASRQEPPASAYPWNPNRYSHNNPSCRCYHRHHEGMKMDYPTLRRVQRSQYLCRAHRFS